ncbi:MAG: hypothetical protein SFU87_09460 [Chitinophagaceae bacterium]|nr:hypothetical protein [Chitinophagaceae bacterium]
MRKVIWSIVVIVLLVLAGFIYWFYFNVYSEGERKGIVIKITTKGNIFKTHEGEMWLSCRNTVNIEKFFFSITDVVVKDSLTRLQDECVQVNYKEYRKTLPWRGDSRYIVTGFQRVTK